MLENQDEDWNQVNAQRRGVTYNNLDAGEYTFKVKAMTDKGVWSREPTALRIIKAQAPWKTWWAYTLYLTTLTFAILFYVKRRTKVLQARAVELEKTVQERTYELADEKNKVEQLLSDKNEEFANVSHEFRTPLTLILGPVAQAIKTSKNEEETKRLSVIQRNGYRLLRMVDQLLNLESFRVQSITAKSPQAFGKTIRMIAEAFSDLAQEKNIDLKIGHIEDISFDFTFEALEKIVLNLLSNAIKYTPQGGQILIESSRINDDQLRIVVRDSGIGIPADKLEDVFKRFNRVLDEQSEQITGSGIGLALVKNLVEAHQGKIHLESEPNKGSTVHYYTANC